MGSICSMHRSGSLSQQSVLLDAVISVFPRCSSSSGNNRNRCHFDRRHLITRRFIMTRLTHMRLFNTTVTIFRLAQFIPILSRSWPPTQDILPFERLILVMPELLLPYPTCPIMLYNRTNKLHYVIFDFALLLLITDCSAGRSRRRSTTSSTTIQMGRTEIRCSNWRKIILVALFSYSNRRSLSKYLLVTLLSCYS